MRADRPLWYRLDGETIMPIHSFGDAGYAAWFEDINNRRIAWTDVGGGVSVSTVFLAIDHAFGGGDPVLFETMIFGGAHDAACWRCTTRAEAEAGHARVVQALQRGENPYGDEENGAGQ